MHGIRWRESTHRASTNLLLSWHARTTTLLEEASTEIGMKLTPLSAPDAFHGLMFQKRTLDLKYGPHELTFVLKVSEYLGQEPSTRRPQPADLNIFECTYMRVLNERACCGERESFSQGDLLAYVLDQSGDKERLYSTKAGKLLKRLTSYKYVKTLAFWVDVTALGKVLFKLFQRSGVLLSDVTCGVKDSIASIKALKNSPSNFMKGFEKDYEGTHETLFGIELTDVSEGDKEYQVMLSNVTSSIADYLNVRFYILLKSPVIKAACIFEHARWPSMTTARLELDSYGEAELNTLLDHFNTLYSYLGGDAAKARVEWRRLKLFVSRNENLFKLGYVELYERLFDHYSASKEDLHYYIVLLIVAIVMCFAVDTS